MSFGALSLTDVLGGLAAIISTASFVPQAWQIIRSKKTQDISTGMYCLTVTGFALWIAFGVALGQWPLIISNAICFLLAGFILTMKLLPKSGKDAVARKVAHPARTRRG